MKKALLTLSLLGLAGAAGFGVASFQNNLPIEVKADSEPVTYIKMEAAAFTDPEAVGTAGTFAEAGATYWPTFAGYHEEDKDSGQPDFNYPFEAIDTFFRGESNEGWTGTLELKPWTQSTQYVYFQWGGARDVDDKVRLEFVCTNTTAAEGEENHGYIYTGTALNNTFTDNKLLLRHFFIPDNEFARLGGANGFSMTIRLVDGRSGDYGFNNFGYLHVNQTKEQVGDAMRYYLNHLSQDNRPSQIARRKSIQGHYFGNDYLKDVFFAATTDISDAFDSQSDFTKHWYFDHKYFNNNGATRSFDTAISGVQNHSNGTPYNMEGSGFFRGYLEGDGTGFMPTDESLYRFISRPFIVDSSNPYISIKMGGRASLHIIDATVNPGDRDDADLAWIDNHFYNIDSGTDPLVYTGWNVTTMRRHIINLQAYAGRKVQLAIADIDGRAFWKAANFDSLEVNINPTSFKVDTIIQNNNEKTFYCAFADKYVSSNHFEDDANGIIYKKPADKVADTTDVKAAADFLSDYYGVIRNTDNGTSFCGADKEILTSDPVKGIVTKYNKLTEGAQKIVCASTDYQQGTYATKDTWFEQAVVSSKVGKTLEYIASYNNIDTTIYGNLAFFGNNTTAISVTVFAGIAGIGAVIAFLFLKKRKEKAE